MRMQVRSLALLSGLRIWHYHELCHGRRGSNLALVWLWHCLAAVALIHLLAWEPPYATSAALKEKKKKRILKRVTCLYLIHDFHCLFFSTYLLIFNDFYKRVYRRADWRNNNEKTSFLSRNSTREIKKAPWCPQAVTKRMKSLPPPTRDLNFTENIQKGSF